MRRGPPDLLQAEADVVELPLPGGAGRARGAVALDRAHRHLSCGAGGGLADDVVAARELGIRAAGGIRGCSLASLQAASHGALHAVCSAVGHLHALDRDGAVVALAAVAAVRAR